MKAQTMTQKEKQAAYDAWYIAEVEKGLKDVEDGRVVTHDAAMKQAREHIAKTAKKHAKKAA